MKKYFTLLCVISLYVACGAAYASQMYTLEKLDGFAVASDMNASGQVVGYGYMDDSGQLITDGYSSVKNALFYDGTSTIVLGPLNNDATSKAYGINDNGQVVGVYYSEYPHISDEYISWGVFLYDDTGMHDLGNLGSLPADGFNHPRAINNSGQIVGYRAAPYRRTSRAFLYDSTSMVDLGILDGPVPDSYLFSQAYDINASGQLVGNSSLRPFLYDSSGIHDLLGLDSGSGSASAINDTGQIVGYFTLSGSTVDHAFLYDSTGMHDLGTSSLYSKATDINASGNIVGRIELPGDANGSRHASVYDNEGWHDLNDLLISNPDQVELTEATKINDRGQILAIGYGQDGESYFLLTPAEGVLVDRYRLYSPITQEHLFTTDANEYAGLGTYANSWQQEGVSHRLYNAPKTIDNVASVPYYRAYNKVKRWHHWTTDPNEYNTLIQYQDIYAAEGVDGYVYSTQVTGSVPLYRLLYPGVWGGLHHWTSDENEKDALLNRGWLVEGEVYVFPGL